MGSEMCIRDRMECAELAMRDFGNAQHGSVDVRNAAAATSAVNPKYFEKLYIVYVDIIFRQWCGSFGQG